MSDNQHDLVQHYLNTQEYLTIKIYDCYLLFHRNIIQQSNNHELGLELPPAIIEKIFGSNPLSVIDVTSTCHVDPSLYDIIIFADKSALYTRTKTSSEKISNKNSWKILPYYVHEDLELLKCSGISKEYIELFMKKLDENDLFHWDKYEHIIQKIIDFTDISTRLNCRLISRKWKTFVDRSSSWNYISLTKHIRSIDQALNYFQKLDIRELDLSHTIFEPLKFETINNTVLFSLRTICISTDYSLECFHFLFHIAPFLQSIKLIQTVNTSSNQFCDYIKFIICLCENNLKYLRNFHIQLRSITDQAFLQTSFISSISISYEIITY